MSEHKLSKLQSPVADFKRYVKISLILLMTLVRVSFGNEPMPMIFGHTTPKNHEVMYGIDYFSGGTIAVGYFVNHDIALLEDAT